MTSHTQMPLRGVFDNDTGLLKGLAPHGGSPVYPPDLNPIQPGTIVLLGCSYTAQNLSVTGLAYRNLASEGFFNFANALSGNRFKVVAYAGIGGNVIQDMIDRYDTDVKPYPSRYVHVDGPANDLYVTVQPLAFLTTQVGILLDKIYRDGRIPIISTLWPHAFSTLTIKKTHQAYNDWVKNGCPDANGTPRPYVRIWDGYAAMADYTSTDNIPRANFTFDGVHHPNNQGGYYLGKGLAPLLRSLEPTIPLMSANEDYTNTTGVGKSNLLDNVTFLGSSGTNTTGGTGTPPTSYALTKTAGGSCNVSTAAYNDPDTGLPVGNYVQLDCTFAAASDEFILASADLHTRMGGAGTTYEAECGFQLVTPGTANLIRFRVQADSGSGESSWFGNNDKALPQNYPEAFTVPRAKTTPIAALGAVVTGKWEFRIKASAAGSASVRVWLPRLRQVS